ncbi:MAG: NAD(+)/NADH kinase [Chlorobi bacterium]|nr:NAD(+)/NADH kinase [Chlorobiota bacterium]MCI0716109.1 NAD(+)/NADH kinase [Chlorobiota bacterium]
MTFGIKGNKNREELAKVVFNLIKDLNKRKIRYVIDKEIAKTISSKFKYRIAQKFCASDKEILSKSDFLVSIGGDGTFLSSAKLVGRKNIPIIGVNLGKLGFLAETSTNDIDKFIAEINKGKYKIEERTVLSARAGNSKKTIYGMNEIVINQTGLVKTIVIQAYYNNQLVNSYHSDGLIVATPTGSTGYSLSAGGPIVYPKTAVFILLPLSPHTLTARPVILSDDGVFKVKIMSEVAITVTADGNSSIKLNSPAEIEIKKAPYTAKLAKSLNSNYFKVLTRKLFWGADIRK